jgi:two-component system response regulator YesN
MEKFVLRDRFVEIVAIGGSVGRSDSADTAVVMRVSPQVTHALQLIDQRYREAGLTVRAIAATLGISTEHLCRLLKQHTGDTFVTLLRRARIRVACQLLQTSTLSMKEIAGRVGFSSASQFDRGFKRVCGMPPTTYRRVSIVPLIPES